MMAVQPRLIAEPSETGGELTPYARLRTRLLVPALGMLTALMALAGSLGAPLVVVVAHDYAVSTATAQWTISLPYLTGAAAMPVVSWLVSTRFRRATTLIVVSLVFLGSLAGALDLGFGALLVARCLQGLGLALVPVAIAVARDSLDGARRTRAIATLSVTNVVAGGIAFALVGLFVDIGGTRLAYWLATGSTLLTLALVAWAMPRGGPDTAARPPDLVGTVLLGGAGAGLLLVLAQGGRWGWSSGATLSVLGASAAALAVWIVWSSGLSRHPFMDLRLARAPIPLAVYVTSFTAGAGMYIMLPLAIVLAQTPTATGWGLGLSVATSGLLVLPYAAANVLGSQLSMAVGRIRPYYWLPQGCIVYALAAAILLVWHAHWWQVLVAMAVAGLGSGLSFAQMHRLLVEAVPSHETGPAIGFSMIVRLMGFSVGSAMMGVALSPDHGGATPSRDTLERGLSLNASWWAITAVFALLLCIVYKPPVTARGS
jgi:MFS family permease